LILVNKWNIDTLAQDIYKHFMCQYIIILLLYLVNMTLSETIK